jgi:uncharacterized protein YegL
MKKRVDIFFCYARKDQEILKDLKMYLMPLQRLDFIDVWHDADISPGTAWEEEIRKHLDTADIILLLISPHFMASEYCYSMEMMRAMERHAREEAHVIPVILRPIYWQGAPFGKLQALPKDALPVTSWRDQSDALFGVAEEIRRIVEELLLSWERADAQARMEEQIRKAKATSATHGVDAQNKVASLPGGEMSARPLHFIWIVDCSFSMKGDKIHSVNTAIREALPEIRKVAALNPHARILVRAITFSTDAQWHIAQPTPIEKFSWTDVTAGGKRDMGRALVKVAEQLSLSHLERRSIAPVLVLVSGGYPTDDFESGLNTLLAQLWGRGAARIAVGIGDNAPYELLQKFIANSEIKPLSINDMDQLVNYIDWLGEWIAGVDRDIIAEYNRDEDEQERQIRHAKSASVWEQIRAQAQQEMQPSLPLDYIWIIDSSDAMKGDKIQSLDAAIRESIPELRKVAHSNPHATIRVHAVTFSTGAYWHVSEPLENFQWPSATAGGERDMGHALSKVAEYLSLLRVTRKRGLPPVLVLISAGYPTDNFEDGLNTLLAQPWAREAVRIAIGIGHDAPYQLLQKFIGNPEIPPLQASNAEQLVNYIKWAEVAIEQT